MIYQPVAAKIQREDCEERYQAIKKCISPFNKSLIDICCANGYFCFRFMQDGGARAVGVERKLAYIDFNNALARLERVDFKCMPFPPKEYFDIGIYLDTHFEPFTKEYLSWLRTYVKVLFTSACKDSDGYRGILKNLKYTSVKPIYQGFQDRVIYKCE